MEKRKYTHENLLNELEVPNEPNDYQNFLHLDSSTFDKLLILIEYKIEEIDTYIRDAIPSINQSIYYTVVLCSIGNFFENLKFISAI